MFDLLPVATSTPFDSVDSVEPHGSLFDLLPVDINDEDESMIKDAMSICEKASKHGTLDPIESILSSFGNGMNTLDFSTINSLKRTLGYYSGAISKTKFSVSSKVFTIREWIELYDYVV